MLTTAVSASSVAKPAGRLESEGEPGFLPDANLVGGVSRAVARGHAGDATEGEHR